MKIKSGNVPYMVRVFAPKKIIIKMASVFILSESDFPYMDFFVKFHSINFRNPKSITRRMNSNPSLAQTSSHKSSTRVSIKFPSKSNLNISPVTVKKTKVNFHQDLDNRTESPKR